MSKIFLAWRLLHNTSHRTATTVMGTGSRVNQGLLHGAITGRKAIHLLSRRCPRSSSNSMKPHIQCRKRLSKGQMLAGIRSAPSIQVSKPLIHPQHTGAMRTHKRSLNTIHPISKRSNFRVDGRVHIWLLAATTSPYMSVLLTSTLPQNSVVSKRTNLTSTWDFFSPCQRKIRRILAIFVRVIT